MPIQKSKRLEQVHRDFYGYSDRRDFYRLDRNEDPVGWNDDIFSKLLKDLSTYDFTAYSDSNNLLKKCEIITCNPNYLKEKVIQFKKDYTREFSWENYLNVIIKNLNLL